MCLRLYLDPTRDCFEMRERPYPAHMLAIGLYFSNIWEPKQSGPIDQNQTYLIMSHVTFIRNPFLSIRTKREGDRPALSTS